MKPWLLDQPMNLMAYPGPKDGRGKTRNLEAIRGKTDVTQIDSSINFNSLKRQRHMRTSTAVQATASGLASSETGEPKRRCLEPDDQQESRLAINTVQSRCTGITAVSREEWTAYVSRPKTQITSGVIQTACYEIGWQMDNAGYPTAYQNQASFSKSLHLLTQPISHSTAQRKC